MKANEVYDHFRQVGRWVDWDNTVDLFLHGAPQLEVNGIATTWIPTNSVIRQAGAKGLNLIISHEPAFFSAGPPRGHAGTESGDRLMAEKRLLLDKTGMAIVRCHDVWDRMPDCGIPDAWADYLGFETEPRPVESYYKICLTGGMTLQQVAEKVLGKVRQLGQDWLLVLGDRDRTINRMAVGTGAITRLPLMYELGIDLALLTDDGMTTWDAGYFCADQGLPLLIANHATAEKPGMMAMAEYLRSIYPDLPVEYVDVELPWRSV